MGKCGSVVDEKDMNPVDEAKLKADANANASKPADSKASEPTASASPASESTAIKLHFSGSNPDEGRGMSKEELAAKEQEDVASYLRNVPLLGKLTEADRKLLASALKEKRFESGVKIVVEGDEGQEFFIIKEGKALVTRINPETQEQTELVHLKRGDYFGETALLTNNRRGATIVAVGPVTCLVLNQEQFVKLFGSEKLNITFAKRAAISAETYTPDGKESKAAALSSSHIPANAVRDKSPETRQMVLGAITHNMLFAKLDNEQKLQIVDSMWLKTVPKGVSIIKQGEMGDNFYVVDKGLFHIFVSKNNNPPSQVASRESGSTFGELALLYNAPRAATVTAAQDSTVWVVDRWTFRRILTNVSERKLAEYENFLKGVSSFEVLLDYERAKIAEALEEAAYPDGHPIVRQGDVGDTFFILKKGEVVATIDQGDSVEEVARYHAGDYFGERSLITNSERAATITCVGPVEVLYLNREAFSLLLGPLEDIFAKRVQSYTPGEGAKGKQFHSSVSSPAGPGADGRDAYADEENFLLKDLKLSDLAVLGTLGKGSFGHVQLVKDKQGNTYALKVVSKAQIVQLGQQEHIMSEKRVMASLNSAFLVRLYATFKDRNSLYFLLEPSLGGELFSVLRARTFFDEDTARFYAASIVLAFEYMHGKGIIYRDLKPENLLLDERGYLKITDFGFAKKINDARTWTLCGTPDYLAPEVVSGQGHGKGVDWWTLGILIYEMLASYPPFYDEDPMKTYAKIMHGQTAFPMYFSKQAVDLIKRLLHPKATKRLGVLKGGAKLVRDHPWFKGFDWDAFEARTMPAPIVLPVKNREDLSNFEEYPEEDTTPEEYIPDPKNPDWDLDF